MKKIYILALALSLLACSKKELKPVVIQSQTGRVTYYLEIADTPEKMTKGLMFRKTLKNNSGMLFIFDEKHPQPIAMWMKNTFISLDMLFIEKSGKIIGIAENTEPLSLKTISPTNKTVSAVIELNAGEVKKHAIQTGDMVFYQFLD